MVVCIVRMVVWVAVLVHWCIGTSTMTESQILVPEGLEQLLVGGGSGGVDDCAVGAKIGNRK